MRFEGKMLGYLELNLRARIISVKGIGSGGKKKRIGVAPNDERRGLMDAEILLELRIQFDVAGIVQKQIQQSVLIAGAREQSRIERIGLGGHT